MMTSLSPFRFLWLVSFVCLGHSKTFAFQLFVNGVDVTGISNQDLKNVDIHIDKDGHMYIQASQYEVRQETSHESLIPEHDQKTEAKKPLKPNKPMEREKPEIEKPEIEKPADLSLPKEPASPNKDVESKAEVKKEPKEKT